MNNGLFDAARLLTRWVITFPVKGGVRVVTSDYGETPTFDSMLDALAFGYKMGLNQPVPREEDRLKGLTDPTPVKEGMTFEMALRESREWHV